MTRFIKRFIKVSPSENSLAYKFYFRCRDNDLTAHGFHQVSRYQLVASSETPKSYPSLRVSGWLNPEKTTTVTL